MLGRVRRPRVLLSLLLFLAGCQTFDPTIDQRTSQGPSATEFWTVRVMQSTGRAPSFDEKQHFSDELDEKIGAYLREHPEAANALNVSSFRFHKQVTVGMERGQVEVLLGKPDTTTRDAAQMQNFARRHWPEIRGKADEAWSYPYGWVVYFSNARVIDITQHLPRT
jgi:hypothetical protein